jgi:nitrite reductase/ring-hydroxylating ferredoxin subunit
MTTPAEAGYALAARLDDVPDGGTHAAVTADGRRMCLVRIGAEVYALANECPHQAYPLSAGEVDVATGELECLWHGARFECATGAVRRGPATEAVATYDVRIEAGEIWVGQVRS